MSAEAMLLRRIEALEIELDAVHHELSRVPVRSPVGSGGGGARIYTAETREALNDITVEAPALGYVTSTGRYYARSAAPSGWPEGTDYLWICITHVEAGN